MRTVKTLNSCLAGLIACVSLSGCASLHDCKYEATQKFRTQKAWVNYKLMCPGSYSGAYAHGWKAGYYDVLTGNDGCPPMFAPERYSAPGKILNDCDQPRNDWYTGFQCGAACAQNMPDTHYMKPWNPAVTAIPVSHSRLAVPPAPSADPDAAPSDAALPVPAPVPGEEFLPEIRDPQNPLTAPNGGDTSDEDQSPPAKPRDADAYEKDPPKPVREIPVSRATVDLDSDSVVVTYTANTHTTRTYIVNTDTVNTDDSRTGSTVGTDSLHNQATNESKQYFERSAPWIRPSFSPPPAR